MRKFIVMAALAASAFATPALAAVAYNSAPADGFGYGTGNNYTPANSAVLTIPAGDGIASQELALRFHQTGQVAPASDSNGVYSFALGTTPISYDFSIDGSHAGAQLTLTNLLTGAQVSYDPYNVFGFGNDNYVSESDPDLAQNSARLNFAFLSGLGFDPNVNDTYRATLTSGGQSLTAFAQIGSGVSAAPEPAIWAMMLLGFGGIGLQMRRRKNALFVSQTA